MTGQHAGFYWFRDGDIVRIYNNPEKFGALVHEYNVKGVIDDDLEQLMAQRIDADWEKLIELDRKRNP